MASTVTPGTDRKRKSLNTSSTSSKVSKASKPSPTELVLQELMFLRSLDWLKDGEGTLKKGGRIQAVMSAGEQNASIFNHFLETEIPNAMTKKGDYALYTFYDINDINEDMLKVNQQGQDYKGIVIIFIRLVTYSCSYFR